MLAESLAKTAVLLLLGAYLAQAATKCGPGRAKCPNGGCCNSSNKCGTTSSSCSYSKGCQPLFGVCTGTPPPSDLTVPATTCGDGKCESPWLPTGENCGNCPVDCGPCQVQADAVDCVEKGVWALTYDDGPSNGPTQTVLNLLQSRGITATFFLIGENIDADATTASLVRQEVGAKHNTFSHTYTHPSLITLSPVCEALGAFGYK